MENDIVLKTAFRGFEKKAVLDFVETLQFENEKLRGQTSELTAENKELKKSVKELKRTIEKLEATIEDLEETIEDLECHDDFITPDAEEYADNVVKDNIASNFVTYEDLNVKPYGMDSEFMGGYIDFNAYPIKSYPATAYPMPPKKAAVKVKKIGSVVRSSKK